MPTLEPSSEDTRVYEVAVLYPATLQQNEEKKVLKEIEDVFHEAEAKLIEKDAWSKRGLAYKIGGHDQGNFVIYYYEMDPSKIKEIDETLRIVPNVLRHLIIKPPKGYQVVKFSEEYEKWLNTRETDEDKKEREKEEGIQKKVAEKAKRQAKRATEKKKDIEETSAPVEKGKIAKELEKIISDDELDL